jgi:hypothetical protein
MDLLTKKRRIDFFSADSIADPPFSTDYLFGEARGKMFGIMVCEARDGSEEILRAFSGQYNGVWNVEGWAPPLFNEDDFICVNRDQETKIKRIGRQIDAMAYGTEGRSSLVRKRKLLSQNLMKEIHTLYDVPNFRGETIPLTDLFRGNGIPTGTGDCCAPKLLNEAARKGLKPKGILEFYWGRENRSKTRSHGQFYASCSEKCQPILGFMLCGLDG